MESESGKMIILEEFDFLASSKGITRKHKQPCEGHSTLNRVTKATSMAEFQILMKRRCLTANSVFPSSQILFLKYVHICLHLQKSKSILRSEKKKDSQEISVMVQMRKLVWAKLKSPFTGTGRSGDEFANTFSSNLNVNEEYKEAFRTKSYEEMWSKVQAQLRRISADGVDGLSSSSSLPFHVHLSDYLFEPNDHKSTLTEMADQMNFHHLLIDYFEASLDACNLCDLLLRSIHQTRVNYRRIEKAIKLGKNVQDSADYTDKICGAILRELASYALLRNPLSFVSPVQFRDVHDTNLVLLHRLSSEQRKIKRKARFNRIWKKIGGYCLVISHTAILIALLVVALHGFVGIIAAPGLLSCSMCLFRKKMKTSLLEKLCGQLDLAAKGTFILINDFDTVNRLVKSLYDELEHKKALAELCVRSENPELLKEVVREFYMHDSCYQEQLDELEEHIYLCFHTINRSRRLVIQEIMVAQK